MGKLKEGFGPFTENNYGFKTCGTIPPGMRRRRDVSFRSHIGRDVADHAKTPSQRSNWYINEMDLSEMSLRRLTGT